MKESYSLTLEIARFDPDTRKSWRQVCFRKRNAASTDVLLSFRPLAENPSHPRGGWSLERAP